jgi:GNAT superfamily N-acetyltransferase
MEAMTTSVTLRHAGDLTTEQAHALVWNVGEIGDRYQEIAIVGDKVIGSWTYMLEWHRGRVRINSGRTDVTPKYRRKGVARRLWFAGIDRWKPTRIEATISTDDGRDFLARMTAEVAYRYAELYLWVKQRTEDRETWEERCNWEAAQLLKRLGDRDRAKQLEAKPLKLIKGATA